MDASCSVINWMPIESFPLFSASVEVIYSETMGQHAHIMSIASNGRLLNYDSIVRIISAYQSMLSKMMCYNAQVERWINESDRIGKEKMEQLMQLQNKTKLTIQLGKRIIEIASELSLRQPPTWQ